MEDDAFHSDAPPLVSSLSPSWLSSLFSQGFRRGSTHQLLISLSVLSLMLLLLLLYYNSSTRWYLQHMRLLYGPDWQHRSPVDGLRRANQTVRFSSNLATVMEDPLVAPDATSAAEAAASGAATAAAEGGFDSSSSIISGSGSSSEKHETGGIGREAKRPKSVPLVGRFSSSEVPPLGAVIRTTSLVVRASVAASAAVPLGLAGGAVGGAVGVPRGPEGMVAGFALGATAGGMFPFHLLGVMKRREEREKVE